MCQSLNIHNSLELPHSTNAQQSITKKSTKEEEKEAEMHQDATKPQDRLLVVSLNFSQSEQMPHAF